LAPVSVQLFSVRDEAAKDIIGVLKKIAGFGYKGVEFAGLHGHSPSEIRKVLEDLGLVASSAHVGLPTRENVGEMLDTAHTLGYSMMIAGRGPDDFKTLDAISRAADAFQSAAALLPKGVRLGYHNHWWEFNRVDGRLGLDFFLERAPGIFSQLDVYWAAHFGAVDVAKFLAEHKKRTPSLHIKDGPLVRDLPHTAVGKGKMNIPSIVKAADPKTLKWLVVELDSCATDMMTAVKESCDYLTSQGLGEGNR